jgi:AAA domain, putative AbiEii toxin, Type IV TA system
MTTDDSLSDPQGSIWRRWDPHIHLPGTLFNDQFGNLTVAEALDILAACDPSVEVACVTDYYTTASFRSAVGAWKNGAGSTIRCLIPNVELRLDIAANPGSAINLHLLCAPEDVDELDRFIGGLEFSHADQTFRADLNGLVALGRKWRNSPNLDEAAALREGAHQFKVSFEELRRQFKTDSWVIKNCIIGVAGGSNDGTSGLQTADGGFAARRREIQNLAHMIFSATPQQVTYWSGLGADDVEKLAEIYGGVKLCIHGSDAHDKESIGAPAEGRMMWLKGNPSFETLKMACLAPLSRAHIGPTPPTAGYSHGRIAKLTVQGPTPWFGEGSLPINPGLVAIIGARGSGKTALADLVAAGAGSDEPFENSASFVRRAAELLTSSQVEVDWSQGTKSNCDLSQGADQFGDTIRPVRYLSQQFVEKLCSSDGVSDELLAEIERVVFEAWPVDQRQNATSFQELLDIMLGAARTRQSTELEAIAGLSDDITEQRVLKDGLQAKTTERAELQRTLQGIHEQTKQLTSKADQESAARLGEINTALQQRQREHQVLDRRVTDLSGLLEEVQSAASSKFPTFTTGLKSKYEATALSDTDWEAFRIGFSGDVENIITSASGEAIRERDRIAGAIGEGGVPPMDGIQSEKLIEKTIAELTVEQSRIQGLLRLDADRTRQLTRLTSKTNELVGKINKLNDDVTSAEGADGKNIELTQQRLARYRSYFDALLEEERELQTLYAPLSSLISGAASSVAKLKFSVRRNVDIDRWAVRGEDFLDLRTQGTFHGSGELARLAREKLLHAWQTGDGEQAAEAIRKFSADHSNDFRVQRKQSYEGGDSLGWDRALSAWLYSAGHITLTYSLEYEKLSIERLSPGSRGIVLLLLYLAVDQEETDPLIIDQPEENLDPESIYTELVPLFRQVSKRRQIIIVTHNANLVVNTDVDQVIVARCESVEEGKLPTLSYQTGGLDDPAIRKSVCLVLEGGEDAFRQRARRLGIEL